jgi:cytochrome P450
MPARSSAEIINFPAVSMPAVDAARRSRVRVLAATIRNPIEALPNEVYEAGLVRSSAFGIPLVHVMDPELIQALLVTEADALQKSNAIRRALGPALGDGLLTSDGAHWRWQRRAAAPAFRPDSLAGFIPTMIAAADRAVDRLQAAGPGATIDVGREMMHTTFDIIGETMLSGRDMIDVEQVAAGAAAYLRQTGWALAMSMMRLPSWVPHPGKYRGERAARSLRHDVAAVVAQRRKSGEERQDLVDRLLRASDPETGSRMSDVDITDNLLTFVAAGHETTALGLAWTLDLLSRHPKAREALLDEIDGVVGRGPLEPAHIDRLVLTRQTFNESMRLYPPAPLISRIARRSVRLGREMFEAGTRFVVPIYAVHHHKGIWHDPERFDPSRFTAERVAARHRYAFMPFGAGPRICIGAGFATTEAVVILASVLHRFRLEATTAQPPAARMEITLRPASVLAMRSEARAT